MLQRQTFVKRPEMSRHQQVDMFWNDSSTLFILTDQVSTPSWGIGELGEYVARLAALGRFGRLRLLR